MCLIYFAPLKSMWAEISQDSPRTFGSKSSFLYIIFPWQCLLFYPQVDIVWPLPLLVWVFNCYFSSFFSTRKLFARPFEIHYPAIASQVRGRWSSCPVLLLNLRSRVLNPCSWSAGHGCIWASSNRGTSMSLLLTALDSTLLVQTRPTLLGLPHRSSIARPVGATYTTFCLNRYWFFALFLCVEL